MTHVTVRYWAGARAAAGIELDLVDVGRDGATLAVVLAEVVGRHDERFARVLGSCSLLLDGVAVSHTDPAGVRLPAGAVLEALPPFAGG